MDLHFATAANQGATMRDDAVRVGTLVRVDAALAEIQTLSGNLVAAERLGPGVVSELGSMGEVKVHGMGADLDAWVQQADLLQFGESARLITVRVFNRFGQLKTARHQVVKGVGLRYNWVVELRPKNIVRTTRPDGQIWTFEWYPMFRRLTPSTPC